MCPACAAMIAIVTAGVASTGALGVVLAGIRRSKAEPIPVTQTKSKEGNHDDNQCN